MHALLFNRAGIASVIAVALPPAFVVAQETYRVPPEPIAACVLAPPPVQVSVSPARTQLLLTEHESLPAIAVLARPLLKLAGVRFDARSLGPPRDAPAIGFELLRIADGARRRVALPPNPDFGNAAWSADDAWVAFTNTRDDAIELWLLDVAAGQARRVESVRLNAVLGRPLQWMPDQRTLLVQLASGDREPPVRPSAPSGPVVQETAGAKSPVRTFQDLLQDQHDADLFEYYATTQLALVDTSTAAVTRIGAPGLYASVSPTPDGTALLVRTVQRPFSYLVPYTAFPSRLAVIDLAGRELRHIADLPLADQVPIGGVPTGPRSLQWIPSEDRTLVWLEALDGGDPRAAAAHRDRVVTLDTTSADAPAEWTTVQHRCTGLQFAADGEVVLLTEFDRDERRTRTWQLGRRGNGAAPQLLFERSTQDAYTDPGQPLQRTNLRGGSVLHIADGALLLSGAGATPGGERPFLDRFVPAASSKQRLFQCAEDAFEQVVAVLDDTATQLLVRHETATIPPSYAVLATATGARRPLLRTEDPVAALTRGIHKRLLTYKREDGLDLSGTLYTPPGWNSRDRLPLLIWAYPAEYTRADDAGQVRGSPNRYTRLSGTSPLLLALAGYAVLDDAAMPIVGPTRTANDTFVPQLVANAAAAIDTIVAIGVADRSRVAISGHSYGAFMTANLLAHSDLFRTGIARSGAYNRTLTPFGFQNEERTLWQAPEVYAAMSPFAHADQINEPLLLIHGDADNNPGTFTQQSQRLFHAIKGHGGSARLVVLPFESHGYRARESALHVLAETVAWLDQHLGTTAPAAIDASATRDKD